MGVNLKRKRAKEDDSRKSRKIEDESGTNADIHGSDAEDAVLGEHGDDEDDEHEDEPMESDHEEDQGEWTGLGGSNSADLDSSIHEPGTKPKKPPTGEELRAIKDATDLFRSNSFKLQIDALLPNVRPKESRIPPLERFLMSLHGVLMGLPSISPLHPLEASRKLLKKGVAVPYSAPLPTEDTNWKVAFEKPSDIAVVGSWPLKTSVKAKDGVRFGVDVAVEMPDELFQEKDYLNNRFFHKKAFYLATIAAALKDSKKSGLNVEVEYDSQSDDPRLTKLVLTPKKDETQNDFTKLHAQVFIIPVLSPHSPIPLHRLSPAHSNLRITTTSSSSAPAPPTPLYNTALLLSLLPKSLLLSTHSTKDASPAFSDALTLLRVWTNQRGYGPASASGPRVCVRGFEDRGYWWGALLGMLISGEEKVGAKAAKRKPLGRGLSSYQLFRGALDFLAKHDFEKDPIFVKTKESAHRFAPEEYTQTHSAVFVDSSSTVNLLAGVPIGSLQLLKHDALSTLSTLSTIDNTSTTDPFTTVFLTDHRDLSTRFDTLLRVDLSSAKPLHHSSSSSAHTTSILDSGSPANALLASLSSLLIQGLGNRVKVAAILHGPSTSRGVAQAHPTSANIIYIGLIHDPEHAFRLVDHGPAASDDKEDEDGEVKRFRNFWGPKAELRRFQDGRITESVVWEVKTADERAHIPSLIVRYILQRHLSITGEEAVQTWKTPYDALLRLPTSVSEKYLAAGVSAGFKGALSAFDTLVKQIKALTDPSGPNTESVLPLSILTISPTSPSLRYTSVFTPVPVPGTLTPLLPPTARYQAPIRAVIEFERSSRWPDDLRAIQSMKLAFFERLAGGLMASSDKEGEGVLARVVTGAGGPSSEIIDQSFVEIITPSGWAFHLSIYNPHECTLLDRIISEYTKPLPPVLRAQRNAQNADGKKTREYHLAIEAKEHHDKTFVHAPTHHRAITSLCHSYPAFSGTVRLVKRWLAAHWLLGGHVSEEAAELICAGVFVGGGRVGAAGIGGGQDGASEGAGGAGGAGVPGSKERGFAEVIRFLKEWKWEEGLFVPLYSSDSTLPGSSSEQDTAKASTATPTSTAAGAGAGVWCLTTTLDPSGRMWTANGPDVVVAHRVGALASATWECLSGVEGGSVDVKAMFIHPTSDYDFIVRLDAGLLPRYMHNVSVDPEVLEPRRARGKYANLPGDDAESVGSRPGFDPARLLFSDLQRIYKHTFKVFHDPLGGDRFGAVWDPTLKEPRQFRVLGEFSSIPVKKENDKAKDKGLVVLNDGAVLNEIERIGGGLVKEITVHV